MMKTSNVKRLPGVWKDVYKYEGEEIETIVEVSLYQCMTCRKIYKDEAVAESCPHEGIQHLS